MMFKKRLLTISIMMFFLLFIVGCSSNEMILKEKKGAYEYVFDSGDSLDKFNIMGEWISEQNSLFDFGQDGVLNWYRTSSKDENNVQGGSFEVIPLENVKDYNPSKIAKKNKNLDKLPVIKFNHEKMIKDGKDLMPQMVLNESNFVVEDYDYDTMTIRNLNTYNEYKLTRK